MSQKYQSVWDAAKGFLLPYDGACSQVYVLGLLKSDIEAILQVISTKVREPVISMLADEPLNSNITLYDAIGNNTVVSQFCTGQSHISAMTFDNAQIAFDFRSEERANTFELEVWFWADQFFPGNDESFQYRFADLCSILADIIRDGNNRCILTPSEASDPLVDLANGTAIELQLS